MKFFDDLIKRKIDTQRNALCRQFNGYDYVCAQTAAATDMTVDKLEFSTRLINNCDELNDCTLCYGVVIE